MKKIKMIAISILLSTGLFAACTPEEMAAWDSLSWVQREQVIGEMSGRAEHRELGKAIAMTEGGYSEADFSCLDRIVTQESRWRNVPNAAGGRAYGIPQALPGSKMATHGADWRTNPATQIRWMLDYIDARYGSACKAWSFKRANGWY